MPVFNFHNTVLIKDIPSKQRKSVDFEQDPRRDKPHPQSIDRLSEMPVLQKEGPVQAHDIGE